MFTTLYHIYLGEFRFIMISTLQKNIKHDAKIAQNQPLIFSSQLNGRAQLTEAVQLISLTRGRLRTSSKCITAGWGDVGDNNTLPARLQEVNVTTLSQQTCRRRWQGVPIPRTMICGVGAAIFQGFCSVRKYTG